MITEDDIKQIEKYFGYAMLRMEELDPLSTWGSLDLRYKRIREEKEKQQKIINKLRLLTK